MPPTIDDARLQELLALGHSERKIATELNVPRTTLKRHLAKLHGKPDPTHTRRVHNVHILDEITAAWVDLAEIIAWWRERKQVAHTPPDPERQPERKTYYVEKRYITAIERASDLEGVSITEIVNRAFQQFFAARK